MSATQRTHFPVIKTTSCRESSDGINVEDLLYRAQRKPNQKTYRNRHKTTVEQEPRNQEAPQFLDVQGKGDKLVTVEKQAAPRKQITKRAPPKALTLVRDVGSSALQDVCLPASASSSMILIIRFSCENAAILLLTRSRRKSRNGLRRHPERKRPGNAIR